MTFRDPTCDVNQVEDPFPPDSSTGRHTMALVWGVLFACSAALLGFSIYRAATFPFTHDESSSFFLLSWHRFSTANNHMLNTLLMTWCSKLFGNSEISLRLPNLLAHLGYLTTTLLFLKRFRHPILIITGFVLLNLNPFLLDFFCLARGYGLALAFLMLSLHLLARAYDKVQQEEFANYLYLSCLAGSVAVLANFAFLNYFLPLVAACTWLLVSDASLRRLSRRQVPAALALLGVSGMFVALVFSMVSELRENGELYFGGSAGFVADTVGSLVRCTLYAASAPLPVQKVIVATVVGLFVVLLCCGLWASLARPKAPLFALFLFIVVLAVASPILQHELFHVLYPIERVALYYLPLYAVLVIGAADWLARGPGRPRLAYAVLMLCLATSAIHTWNLFRGFNPRACYSWGYDRHNVEVLELIDRDRKRQFPGQVINLTNSWLQEPSLYFYRTTRNYTWLRSGIRKTMSGRRPYYSYLYTDEVTEPPAWRATRLASFPDTATVLLRWHPADP